MISALVVCAAVLLDAWFGEPRRLHPLVGFGRCAQTLERRMHADSRVRGGLGVLLLLAPLTLLTLYLAQRLPYSFVFDALVLYLAIGRRSLEEHAGRVRDALAAGDLRAARERVGFMVSRDTAVLDAEGVSKATVESVLENGNDAVFGAIFWFLLAGAPGVVLYRLANTLDAMWGYRNARYRHFGWAAARLDDGLNFIPARLTALSYALAGNTGRALRCWRLQGAAWKSPNAGPVMAAGAGSIGVLLGGAADYYGAPCMRPTLGEGALPAAEHIERALGLVRRALLVWVSVLFAGGLLAYFFAVS